MKVVCLALACVLFLAAASRAQTANAPAAVADPPRPPPRSYTVECQMVRVPAKAVVTLVPELDDEDKAVAAWEKVQAMIARGEATLAAYLLGKGVAREAITAESAEEMRYPTELDCPTRPPDSHFSRHAADLLKVWPFIGIVPTAFDTHKLGQFMEAKVSRTTDPTVLDCVISVKDAQFQGFRRFPAGRLENGEQLAYEQLKVSELKDLASLSVTLGRPALIGVHPVPGKEQAFELFILRITAERRAAP